MPPLDNPAVPAPDCASECDTIDTIRTFWHGSELSVYEELCLKSFSRYGHRVQLFSYSKLRPIPGIEMIDASIILPPSAIFSYQHGPGLGSFAAFANLFRYKLLHDLGGTWSDLDVLCLKSFKTLPFNCVARQNRRQLNTAILRFQPQHPLLKALYEQATRLGRSITWGQSGPQLITQMLPSFANRVTVLPPKFFYPIPHLEAWKLVSPTEFTGCETRSQQAYAVHWWNEMLRRLPMSKELLPPVDSWLQRHSLGILQGCRLGHVPFDQLLPSISRYLYPRSRARQRFVQMSLWNMHLMQSLLST